MTLVYEFRKYIFGKSAIHQESFSSFSESQLHHAPTHDKYYYEYIDIKVRSTEERPAISNISTNNRAIMLSWCTSS